MKLNLGLRYELFGRPKAKANPLLPQTGIYPTDKNNWAPRVGLAWDPTGSGRTAVRAGVGRYYNVFVTQNFNTLVRSNGADVITVNMTPTTPGAPPFSLTRVTPPSGQQVISEVRMMASNLEVDRGRNDNDMRHRFTTTGAFEPRWSSLTGTAAALLNGWQLSTRMIAQSGFPYNALTGQDANGDLVFNDRPSGIAYNAFTLPSFFTLDLRLSRKLRLGDQRVLELMAEGFNMTNRRNITGLNATWGPNPTPNATFGQPTFAEAPRQFQLAMRFTF